MHLANKSHKGHFILFFLFCQTKSAREIRLDSHGVPVPMMASRHPGRMPPRLPGHTLGRRVHCTAGPARGGCAPACRPWSSRTISGTTGRMPTLIAGFARAIATALPTGRGPGGAASTSAPEVRPARADSADPVRWPDFRMELGSRRQFPTFLAHRTGAAFPVPTARPGAAACCGMLGRSAAGQTHHAQTPVPEYRCEVPACDGSNPTSRHRLLAETAVAGFVPDLSRPQRLSLSLARTPPALRT